MVKFQTYDCPKFDLEYEKVKEGCNRENNIERNFQSWYISKIEILY